jgi:hypothetical protein
VPKHCAKNGTKSELREIFGTFCKIFELNYVRFLLKIEKKVAQNGQKWHKMGKNGTKVAHIYVRFLGIF